MQEERTKKSTRKLLEEIHQRMDEVVIPAIKDHEQRLRLAEKNIWYASGAAATLGGLLAKLLHW